MNRRRLLVRWTPHQPHDTFVVAGADLRVYQVEWRRPGCLAARSAEYESHSAAALTDGEATDEQPALSTGDVESQDFGGAGSPPSVRARASVPQLVPSRDNEPDESLVRSPPHSLSKTPTERLLGTGAAAGPAVSLATSSSASSVASISRSVSSGTLASHDHEGGEAVAASARASHKKSPSEGATATRLATAAAASAADAGRGQRHGLSDVLSYESVAADSGVDEDGAGTSYNHPVGTGSGAVKSIRLVRINTQLQQQARCFAWSPVDPDVVAVGMPTGRILLTAFDADRVRLSSNSKELVPRHPRTCNAISWNQRCPELLAAGYDKVRSSPSAIVWDVNSNRPLSSLSLSSPPHADSPSALPFSSSAVLSSAHQTSFFSSTALLSDDSLRARRAPRPVSSSSSSSAAAPAYEQLIDGGDAFNVSPLEAGATITEPLFQLSTSEAAVAVEWWPSQPRCLAVGTGAKWLRLFDLRTNTTTAVRSVVAHSRAVQGVCFDPFQADQVATFSDEGHIKIWDVRMLITPSFSLPTDTRISNIAWCPHRPGVLATFAADEQCVKIWQLRGELHKNTKRKGKSHTVQMVPPTVEDTVLPGRDDAAALSTSPQDSKLPLPVEREDPLAALEAAEALQAELQKSNAASAAATAAADGGSGSGGNSGGDGGGGGGSGGGDASDAQPLPTTTIIYKLNRSCQSIDVGEPVSSLSWHGADGSWLVAVTHAGVVKVLGLRNPTPLVWSPLGSVAFASQQQQAHTVTQYTSPMVHVDDVSQLMSERARAGYSLNAKNNATLDCLPASLQDIWRWIDRSCSAPFQPAKQLTVGQRGLVYLVNYVLPQQTSAAASTAATTDRRSPHYNQARALAVELCLGDSLSYQEQLIATGQYTRAAAHAIFDGDVRRAVDILQLGAVQQPALQLLAVAVAGFSESEKQLWRSACLRVVQAADVYMQAAFTFLYNDPEHFNTILGLPQISLTEKLSLACRIHTDAQLVNWVQSQEELYFDDADITGLLLSGLTSRGLDLLQRYLDKTGDVQTATLLGCQVVPYVLKDARVTRWVHYYRQFLNVVQLWNQRAEFDTTWRNAARLDSHIFARCQYCNISMALPSLLPPKTAMDPSSASYHEISKATRQLPCCSNCSKPLPKCSVCLLPVNFAVPIEGAVAPAEEQRGRWRDGSIPFGMWASWCQTCRHGGHADHIFDWFLNFPVCPVSECNCCCASI